MSKQIQNIGGIRQALHSKEGDIFLYLNYKEKTTVVAARLASGAKLVRSKNYFEEGTSSSTEKHITLFGRWLVEKGFELGSWETIEQTKLEELTPLALI
tara:strand:+ start:2463 stop:2759 length:297 start_codon:yes stop_codon:yes gene_type:complete